jgi:hypothetical protein
MDDQVEERKRNIVFAELDDELMGLLNEEVPRHARRLGLTPKRARSAVIRLALAQFLGVAEQKPAA